MHRHMEPCPCVSEQASSPSIQHQAVNSWSVARAQAFSLDVSSFLCHAVVFRWRTRVPAIGLLWGESNFLRLPGLGRAWDRGLQDSDVVLHRIHGIVPS